MKWKPTEAIFFHEGIGTYETTPIGRVSFSVGLGGQGVLAITQREGVMEKFLLDPLAMLEGLMEHYGVPIPETTSGGQGGGMLNG